MAFHRLWAAPALFALLALLGCAPKPPIPFDRATAGNIRTIGVITPRFPDHPRAVVANEVYRANGLLLAAIYSGLQSNREARLQRILSQSGFSIRGALIARLQKVLQGEGYVVTMIPVVRPPPAPRDPSDPRDHPGFLHHYPANVARVNAYLDLVTPEYGYARVDVAPGMPWRPQYTLRARLVSARNGTTLMEDAIVYNPIMYTPDIARFQAVTIPPDPVPHFANLDEMAKNPTVTAQGVQAAIAKVADTVGKLLR